MTILITGGAGFIGSALTTALLESTDEDIVVVDSLHPQVHGRAPVLAEHFAVDRITFVQGDVAEASTWQRCLRETSPRVVIHLAAETGTGQSLFESTRHANVNVNGTAAMIDALASARKLPERIILSSSRAVYGEGKWQDPTDGSFFYAAPRGAAQLAHGEWEPLAPSGQPARIAANNAKDTEPRPTNVYAATKLAQEHILTAWCTALGPSLTILRLQNVYGAGQAIGNPYTGVLTYFARQLITEQPVRVFEGGGIVRDFVHVSDVVSAICLSMASTVMPGTVDTYDIGSGVGGTLHDFAIQLATETAGTVVVTDEYRLGDVRAAYADISEAESRLSYRPGTPFDQGARDLLTWVATQS